jgi:2-polyprenyl-6-methoxyphenol hydroxylase-like FAD-dependent oxidoreductase
MVHTGMVRVLVVGGGIAGLAHAIAARRAGHDVEVLEIRPDWTVAGWGLSLTGPAVRALRAIDLADECIAAGAPIRRTQHNDPAGELRATTEPPSVLGPGQPAEVGMGRPELHRILRERAAALGAGLHTGRTVGEISAGPDGLTARLSDGTVRTVDYLVGADGVRSRTRELLGLAGEPWYTGQMVWRALVDRPAWAADVHTFGGAAGTTGVIPISPTQAYVFLTEARDVPGEVPEEELATRMRELLAPFGGRFAAVRDTITAPDQVVRRPILALLVEGPWHAGRGVLVGDAAHSPSPQMVSGAALAIEDAVVLADEVARHDDLEAAFTTYEDRRRDRVRALLETSLEIGRREREGRHHEVHQLLGRGHAAMAAPI